MKSKVWERYSGVDHDVVVVVEHAPHNPAIHSTGNWVASTRYVRIGVLRVEIGSSPRIGAGPGAGVREVVKVWDKLHTGKNFPEGACAGSRAYEKALSLASKLSKEEHFKKSFDF